MAVAGLRVQIVYQASTFTFPINPREYQNELSFDYTLEDTIMSDSTRFTPWADTRKRVMTWRNLPNKTPYNTLYTNLLNYVGVSGVQMNVRDLSLVGDINQLQNIRVEDVKIRKVPGTKKSTSYLHFDLDLIFSFL